MRFWWIFLSSLALAVFLFVPLASQPGLEQSKFKPLGYGSNGVSSQSEDWSRYIEPVRQFGRDPFQAISAFAEARGGEVISQDGQYLCVEFPRAFVFWDRAEFYLEADKIHMRSEALRGYTDFGRNRARLEELRLALLRNALAHPVEDDRR